MDEPIGAISIERGGYLRKRYPNKPIFLVSGSGKLESGPARDFIFNCDPPTYYFDNYFLAYGHSLRVKERNS